MSDKRKKLSGSSYRKLASEKREKETNLLKDIKRVDSFFKPVDKNHCEEGCSTVNQGNSNPSYSSENKNTEQSNTTNSVDYVNVASNFSLNATDSNDKTITSKLAIKNSDVF